MQESAHRDERKRKLHTQQSFCFFLQLLMIHAKDENLDQEDKFAVAAVANANLELGDDEEEKQPWGIVAR